jgi:branched-chain amino acid transport system permease protein
MTGLDRRTLLGILLLLAIACALPFLVANYRIFQFTLVLAYSIALLGLNMLTGFNGQISLGHGAFYAIGAYAAAILMDKAGLPYWATIPIAGAVCFVAGFLFGLPALRLEGLYLALATFALGVAMPQILKHKSIEAWTGGVQGIVIVKPDPPAWSGCRRTSGSTSSPWPGRSSPSCSAGTCCAGGSAARWWRSGISPLRRRRWASTLRW